MLSRFFYFLLAAAAGAGVAAAFIAQDQINRNFDTRLEEQLRRDRVELELWLRYDARARLDDIAPMAANSEVRAALQQASRRRDRSELEASLREGLGRKLAQLNSQLQEGAAQLLFAVDAQGEIIAQLGGSAPPAGAGLRAFPVVERALSGYLTDDVLIYNGIIYRVAARPVIDGGRYVGAIVHCMEVSPQLTARLASRIPGASLGFFARERLLASHIEAGQGVPQAPQIEAALAGALEDPGLASEGRTDPLPVGETGRGIFSLVTGSAAHAQVGYVITRSVSELASPLDLFRYEESLASVPWVLVGLLVLVLGLLGLLFMWLEHVQPYRRFRGVAQALAKGELQRLDETKLNRRYRQIAQAVNQGLERVAGSGAGATKQPKDLDAILGATPERASSTPFFGFAQDDVGPEEIPPVPDPPLPEPQAPAPATAPSPPAAPPAPPLAAVPPPAPAAPLAHDFDEDEGQTMVAQIPEELLAATSEANDEEAQFRQVFEEFVATKRECGESTAGLTFERFSQTLRKNRDAIISKHGAKGVRFTVYKKNGKAALKATPTRD